MKNSAPLETELSSIKTFHGNAVPALGFGTYQLEGKTCRQAVEAALGIGYRHIDTARAYGNEEEVGRAIHNADAPREDIFLTTKIWWEDLSAHTIQEEIECSLRNLQTDFLDLVLIHWPNLEYSLMETIYTLNELKQIGKIRNYGVSNFTPTLLHEALGYGDIFCNQVEYHPFLQQDALLEIVRNHGSALTAYAPLAQGEVIGNSGLNEIARKHNRSTAQIVLRWLIEQDNVLAIPRSSKVTHIENNFDIFDFELDEEDDATIRSLPKNHRKIDPEFAPDWENEAPE